MYNKGDMEKWHETTKKNNNKASVFTWSQYKSFWEMNATYWPAALQPYSPSYVPVTTTKTVKGNVHMPVPPGSH